MISKASSLVAMRSIALPATAAATPAKGQTLLDAVGVQLAKLLQELVQFEPLI